MDTFSSSIDNILIPDHASTPEELIAHYNNGLNNILNCLAPMKTRCGTFTQNAPWFTPELRSIKAKGWQLEWLYRKSALTVHKELYKTHLLHYNCPNQIQLLLWPDLF